MQVSGLAPAAARYAGFSEKRNIWLALLIGGGMAGFAGMGEVAGPIGQLQPAISPGYGFAAIIVAFIGRLHPLGVLLASLLMSLLYLGGETAQINLGLPSAVTGLFQGLLLFLSADTDFHLIPQTPRGAGEAQPRCCRGAYMNVEQLVPILASTVAAATPLAYAAFGELVTSARVCSIWGWKA